MNLPHRERRSLGPDRRGGGGGRALSVAGEAPGTSRGGVVSESVAKAPRTGIGRGRKRGISTFLFRRSGSIRAFATDLDKRRRCGPRDGRHGSRRRPRAPPTPRRALRTRKCSSNRHSRVQSAPLECKMHISARKGPVGRAARVRAGRIPHSGRRIPDAAPRARRTARSSLRRPSRHRPSRRRNPTRSRHAARRSDGLSPPMPDRAGFITLTG